jgi:hypothetical protein
MHPAALPGGTDEHRGDGGLEAEMVIGDDELHAAQPAGAQASEEGGPEGAVLRVADVDAEHLAVAGGGDTGGDHHGAGHDPAPDPALEVGGVDEHVREPGVVQGPVPERLKVPVQVDADPTDFALGDAAGGAEGL